MGRRILIGSRDDFPEGVLRLVEVEGEEFVVARTGQRVCVAENRCPHLEMPLENGTLIGGVLVCLWHAAQFNLCSGENLRWAANEPNPEQPDLPASARALTTFQVIEEAGRLYIEM